MNESRDRLTAVFAKRPLPGAVKTRLCPPLDPEQAARLADAMLRDVVERCLSSPDWTTALVFAPASEETWFRGSFPDVEAVRPQRGEGLGERLAAFFADEQARRPEGTTVVLGADAPVLGNRAVLEAHRRLEAGADAVLAPDRGGGYALVGLRRAAPELFTGVPMSTPDNFQLTLEVARGIGLEVALLEPAGDVDVPDDLAHLREDLAGRDPDSADFPRRTAAVLSTLPEAFP